MNQLRYCPERSFPEYAFVPGQHPHPVTDARGHSYGHRVNVPAPLNPQQPRCSSEYLFAIDLFNHGYYWEAHEGWEGLWVVAGRSGVTADFLKGLIKLAAAGVKSREGQPTGVQRHAIRAVDLFQQVMVNIEPADESGNFAGLALQELVRFAASLAAQPKSDRTPTKAGNAVLSFQLELVNS